MEKNDRRAVPPNFIEDLGVVAAQAFHGRRLEHSDERGAKLCRALRAEARISSGWHGTTEVVPFPKRALGKVLLNP
jgi:hypothetical protein